MLDSHFPGKKTVISVNFRKMLGKRLVQVQQGPPTVTSCISFVLLTYSIFFTILKQFQYKKLTTSMLYVSNVKNQQKLYLKEVLETMLIKNMYFALVLKLNTKFMHI